VRLALADRVCWFWHCLSFALCVCNVFVCQVMRHNNFMQDKVGVQGCEEV